jgi:hypothetical protein
VRVDANRFRESPARVKALRFGPDSRSDLDAAARTAAGLDDLGRKFWSAWGEGQIDDAAAATIGEAVALLPDGRSDFEAIRTKAGATTAFTPLRRL